MEIALIIISIAVAVFGFFQLTEATFGIGMIGIAALVGIYARLVQASDQHHKIEIKINNLYQMVELTKHAINEVRDNTG